MTSTKHQVLLRTHTSLSNSSTLKAPERDLESSKKSFNFYILKVNQKQRIWLKIGKKVYLEA